MVVYCFHLQALGPECFVQLKLYFLILGCYYVSFSKYVFKYILGLITHLVSIVFKLIHFSHYS